MSRGVNGARTVDPDIQELVRHAIARTGYAPNRAARSLVTRRAETVALVISGAGDAFAARMFADPFFGRIVTGAPGAPAGARHASGAAVRRVAGRFVEYVRQGSRDGVLVISIQGDDPLFARPSRPVPISHVDVRAGSSR